MKSRPKINTVSFATQLMFISKPLCWSQINCSLPTHSLNRSLHQIIGECAISNALHLAPINVNDKSRKRFAKSAAPKPQHLNTRPLSVLDPVKFCPLHQTNPFPHQISIICPTHHLSTTAKMLRVFNNIRDEEVWVPGYTPFSWRPA